MIGIQLDGDTEFLATNTDTKISLRLENPIFFTPEKISPGSFSLPFPLPNNNFAKLRNPQVIENNENFVVEKASLFFDGVPLKKGNINLSTIEEKISAYFTFGLNTISDAFKTAKLRDAVSQVIVINTDAVVKKVHTNCLQINIVINGIDHTKSQWYYSLQPAFPAGPLRTSYPPGPTTEYVPFIEQVTTASPGGRIDGFTDIHYVVRMVKFQLVNNIFGTGKILVPIDCTDPNIEFSVEIRQDAGTFIAQPEIDGYYDGFTTWLQPFLTDTIPATDPLKYLRFPTIASSKLNTSKDSILINHQDGHGNIIPNTPEHLYKDNLAQPLNNNSIQPFTNLRGVLAKIASFFNFEYEGDFWDDARLDETLIWNTSALDLPLEYIQKQIFNFWRRSFNYNELVPDITVVEFFKLLQGSFNIAIYYNEVTRKVRLKYRENIAKAIEYDDITKKTSIVKLIVPVTITPDAGVQQLLKTLRVVNLSSFLINLDVVNTVVVNETSSGAGNGSIHVATTGDVALYEFSKDNGATWQSSPIFAPLTTGIYLIKVRQVAFTTLVEEYPFAVNHANTNFDFTLATAGESSVGAHDGTIEVVFDPYGDWAFYEYSKDLGATWNAPHTYTGLAPGTYYIAARRVGSTNAVVRVVTVDVNYTTANIRDGVPDFNFAQGDSFDLQFLKYAGLNTLSDYSYPYVDDNVLPTSPIWDKMQARTLSVKVDMVLNLVDVLRLDWELKRRFNGSNYLYKTLDLVLSNQGIRITQVELYTLR